MAIRPPGGRLPGVETENTVQGAGLSWAWVQVPAPPLVRSCTQAHSYGLSLGFAICRMGLAPASLWFS